MDVVMPKLLRSMALSSFCVFAPGLGEHPKHVAKLHLLATAVLEPQGCHPCPFVTMFGGRLTLHRSVE